jgi:hypothetical protein
MKDVFEFTSESHRSKVLKAKCTRISRPKVPEHAIRREHDKMRIHK